MSRRAAAGTSGERDACADRRASPIGGGPSRPDRLSQAAGACPSCCHPRRLFRTRSQQDFPISRIHPAATEAAVAARCAGAQGKYWEMHDRFFANQSTLAQRKWQEHATALGLDGDTFKECMADKNTEVAVRRSLANGRKAGVTGTPAFYLGIVSDDGKTLKATELIRGARPYDSFKQVIDRLIAKHAG